MRLKSHLWMPVFLAMTGIALAVSQTTIAVKDAGGTSRTINTTPAAGAAGTPSTDVTTVQGCPTCTPQPVNVSQINGATPLMGAGATGTGSPRVTAASDSPEVTVLGTTADSAYGGGGSASIDAILKGIYAAIIAPVSGGTNTIGNTIPIGSTASGNTPYSLIAANTTNSTSVKASAGTRYDIEVYSISSTATAWLKIYDTAGAPTCGSGTPKERHLISYGSSATGGGAVITSGIGVAYASGIGFCITGGIGDADTTAVAASTFVVNIAYK